MKTFRLLALLLIGTFVGACSSSDATQKCETPLDCDQAFTCIDGKCAQLVCATYDDCPRDDETCLPGADPSQPELKFCTPVECNTSSPCETGYVCNEFYQCVAGGGDAVDGDVVAMDALPTDITKDLGEEPGTGVGCKACDSDGECDGSKCTPLGGGKYCFDGCAVNDDCESGWYCDKLDNQSSLCIPMAFNCDADCHASGCPDGQVCNQDSGACQDGAAECGACQQDWDCGAGFRCYNEGKYCAPGCDGGCPNNSACQEVNSIAVNLCIAGGAPCCFGDECVNPCSAPTPYLNNTGACVECLNDGQCGDGEYCEELSESCMDDACQAPTPFQLEDGSCVECKNDSHCTAKGEGYKCKANVCTISDLPEECSLCVAPYPACAEINGIWACVQCAADSDCGNGTCDLSLYACSGGGVGPGCGSCTQDGDCISAMGDKTLACDAASGCCYDVGGFCDNVESMCDATSGSECKGLMDLLMGGMGGIPGMPEDSAGGICTCDAPVALTDLLLCMFMGGCPSTGCLGDSVCVDPAEIPLLGDIVGAIGGAAGICINPASLSGLLPI
jgi:Cys-rich repeat protein